MRPPIVIAAGGTGGHLFPAQALGEELTRRNRKIVLITDERGMKWQDAFPGSDLFMTQSGTTTRAGLVSRILAVFKLGFGTVQAMRLLNRFKPDVVIGFGGYPTLPAMFAALLQGYCTCLHEQNGVMGRANKLLAPRLKGLALTFPSPKGMRPRDVKRATVTGNPVRANVIAASATPYPPLDDTLPIHLVIFGGSQGAQILSTVVPEALAQLPDAMRARLRITQQCREDDLPTAKAAYANAGIAAELATFYNDLPELLSQAHLVICRSGASTVCELTVLGRPAILVPLPGAIDQDQAANAQFLVDHGGGWLMPQAELTADALAAKLSGLLSAPHVLQQAAAAAKSQGRPDAVIALADYVEDLASGE